MRGPHNLIRLVRTGATFQRTGAMAVALNALQIHPNLKMLARTLGVPFAIFGLRGDSSLPPVVRALTALGPAYIKFGQLLSTRPDIVGKELASELQLLLDKLPPFPTSTAKSSIEEELEIRIADVFSEFSDSIAAASIAQVHKAVLKDTGQPVAVKVLRPNIERAFKKDIDAFYLAAGMVKVLSPASRRLRPRAVVEHFEGVVNRELDLRLEAAAADEFAATTAQDEGICVPEIKWALSSKKALTLEWAEGINLNDIEALRSAGHDLELLASRLIQMFLRQALRDGFFHADLHQGNLKVNPAGDIIALDFGIMGRIDSFTRRVYAEILHGFITQNYHRVAEVHFEAGYVPANQNVDDFAQALRAVSAPILGMDASHISMAKLLAHLFEVTERFGMETRTELILLQRTMVVVEGVARSLDPKLNMWTVAQPVVKDYISDHVGPAAVLRDAAATLRALAKLPPQLPQLVDTLARLDAFECSQATPDKYTTNQLIIAGLLGFGLASLLALIIL